MKRCKRFRTNIVAHLNGELGRMKRSGMERHLEKCTGCFREYQRQKRMEELLLSEMGRIWRKSNPLLTWGNLRPALEREAAAAEKEIRWTSTVKIRLTCIQETLFPKVRLTVAEAIYWGKRASIPVANLILAVLLYNVFLAPDHTPTAKSTGTPPRSPMLVRINFGPEGTATLDKYYTDAGRLYRLSQGNQNGKKFGWRKKNSG